MEGKEFDFHDSESDALACLQFVADPCNFVCGFVALSPCDSEVVWELEIVP